MALSYSLSTPRLGTTSASSLVKSALTLQNEVSTYNDAVQRIQFENNPTEDSLQQYLSYLNDRIKTLSASGTITNMTKAADLTQTMHSAVAKSTSFQIQTATINVMAGNATKIDKLNFISQQFQRAQAIGDETLAQSLESQAYSLSQQIQYEQQQASSAAKTLADAQATSEKDISTTLGHALDALSNAVSHSGMLNFNAATAQWVKDNTKSLEALGVIVNPNAEPNYFDLVSAVVGAQVNHLKLAQQAAQPYNPYAANLYGQEATNLQSGATTVGVLGHNLTIQQIQQAAQDPNMFSYNYASGKLDFNKQIGYQYINGQVAPLYSNFANSQSQAYNKVYFINPQQVALMKQLGLEFSINGNNSSNKGGANNGITVQLTDSTPQWLKNLVGGLGETQFFTDNNGNLQFEGSSTTGAGLSYYTLSGSAGGQAGVFEHLADGKLNFVGGDAGFNPGAASLLINNGVHQQVQIKLASSFNKTMTQTVSTKPVEPQFSATVTQPHPMTLAPKVTFSNSVTPSHTVNPQQANGRPAGFETANPDNSSRNSTNILQGTAPINLSSNLGVGTANSSGINITF